MGCNHFGNTSMLKKVPDNRNCGRVMILEMGGMVLSLFAMPETTKPNPIKTTTPRKERIIMLRTVSAPFIRVKLKK